MRLADMLAVLRWSGIHARLSPRRTALELLAREIDDLQHGLAAGTLEGWDDANTVMIMQRGRPPAWIVPAAMRSSRLKLSRH